MSEDGEAGIIQVPVRVDPRSNDDLRMVVDGVRDAVADGLPAGLGAPTTGGPAFGADIAASFDGANVRLLLVTIGVVGLLLLLTYRSPVLWLVPLVVVGVADQLATVVTRSVGQAYDLNFDGGIISVLVFGAGANYALLLISRYREELHVHEDHRAALQAAWRGSVPAILASNFAVVLALSTLVLATLPGTRGLGIASAVGLIVALAAVVFVLPPTLAIVGRGAFWPFVPRPGAERGAERATGHGVAAWLQERAQRLSGRHGGEGAWGSVAGAVVRHPGRVLAAGVALPAVMATGLIGTNVGLSQVDRFRGASESAAGVEAVAQHFPAGSAAPFTIVTDAPELEAVTQAVSAVDGVEMVRPGPAGDTASRGEVATLTVVGNGAPGSRAERDLVERLRATVHAVPGADALVGGSAVTDIDSGDAARTDLFLVAPLVLTVVGVVLAGLLRSLVAPFVLLAVSLASTLAAIGAGAWIGRHGFGWAALDTDVPLLAFLLLVALGIDYTIFLVHRVGLIVGLGVVVDTLIVRTLFVPAVITLVGDRFWLPSRPQDRPHTQQPAVSTADKRELVRG